MRHKKILWGAAILLLLLVLARGFLLDSDTEALRIPSVSQLNGQWEQLPSEGGRTRYGSVLPSHLEAGQMLSLKIYFVDAAVYLDEEALYTYEDPFREKGAFTHWIPLPDDASGKTLILESSASAHDLAPTLKSARIGDSSQLLLHLVRENLYALLFGTLALFLSGFLFLFRCMRPLSKKAYRGVEYFNGFLFLAGLWVVTDSQILRLFTGRIALISLASFLSFILMPAFILLFVNEILIYRSRLLDVLCRLYFAAFAAAMLCYLFRIAPLAALLPVVHLLILVSILALLQTGLREVRLYNNREMRSVLIGLAFLSAFSLTSLVLFYYSISAAYPYLYCIGILFFSAFMAAAAFGRFQYYAEHSASASMYQRLAYVDSMTGIGSRTAFEQEQKRLLEQESPLAYIVLDINNLKQVNDRYGHPAGDRLITDVAACLREVFDDYGKCFRIGGDEFVVLMETCDGQALTRRMDLLREHIAQKNKTREFPIEIALGGSFGSSQDPRLLTEADEAMYQNKSHMKHRMD